MNLFLDASPSLLGSAREQPLTLYKVWHCAGLRLMENSFDGAHPHFVHAKSFGDQQNPVPPERQVINRSEWSFDTYPTD
ncbi:MAG: hypothetical protein SNJ85_03605 [Cyanobacteriota bacterium]